MRTNDHHGGIIYATSFLGRLERGSEGTEMTAIIIKERSLSNKNDWIDQTEIDHYASYGWKFDGVGVWEARDCMSAEDIARHRIKPGKRVLGMRLKKKTGTIKPWHVSMKKTLTQSATVEAKTYVEAVRKAEELDTVKELGFFVDKVSEMIDGKTPQR